MKLLKIFVLNLSLLAFSLSFTGCSTKQPPVVFKDRFVCIDFIKFDRNKKIIVEVANYDFNLATARADELHEIIDLYEFQIDKYNELCEKYRLFGNTEQVQN